VRRIVVTYQYENDGGGDTNLYAGRLQYNISQAFQSQSWIGATYLRQDQGIQDLSFMVQISCYLWAEMGSLLVNMPIPLMIPPSWVALQVQPTALKLCQRCARY
jgi:hypothetical protein